MSLAASASPSALIMEAVFSLFSKKILFVSEHDIFLSFGVLLGHLLVLDGQGVVFHKAQMDDGHVI